MKDYLINGKYWNLIPQKEREKYFNGPGPEWFPDELRSKLDKVLHIFRPAFDRHDLGYEFGETWEEKDQIDLEMFKNHKAILWHEIILKDPFSFEAWKDYFKWRGIAKILYNAVKYGGSSAFWHEEKLKRLGLNQAPAKGK